MSALILRQFKTNFSRINNVSKLKGKVIPYQVLIDPID